MSPTKAITPAIRLLRIRFNRELGVTFLQFSLSLWMFWGGYYCIYNSAVNMAP